MKRLRDLSAIALLGACLVILFRRTFFGGCLLSNNEILYLHYSHIRYFFEYLRQGQLVLWTPELFCGFPYVANLQLSLLYPVNYPLFLWLPTETALTVAILGHFFLGGVLVYFCAREFGASRPGSLLSAAAFTFSGFVLSHAELHTADTIAWLPLVLLAFERAAKRQSYGYTVLTGLALGLQFLGGHLQFSYYVCLVFGGHVLLKCIAARRSRESLVKTIAMSVIAFAIGLGLFAFQFLPTYELAEQAARSEVTYEIAVEGAGNNLSAKELVELVLPKLFGGEHSYPNVPGHLGAMVIALALAALLLRRDAETRFLAIVFGLSLLLAAGRYTPVFSLVYHSGLPGFTMFHDPIRIMYLVSFSAALLAGRGLDAVGRVWERRRRPHNRIAVIAMLPALLALAAWCGWLVPQFSNRYRVQPGPELVDQLRAAAAIEIGVLTVLAILWAATHVLSARTRRIRRAYAGLIVALTLANLLVFGDRISGEEDRGDLRSKIVHPTDPWDPTPAFRVFDCARDEMAQCRRLPFEVASVSGFSSLALQRYLELTRADAAIDATRQIGYPHFLYFPELVRLMGCRYVFLPFQRLRRVDNCPEPEHLRHLTMIDTGDSGWVFECPDPLPRVRLLPPDSDWGAGQASLESMRAGEIGPVTGAAEGSGIGSVDYRPMEVRVQTAQAGSYVVLHDSHYPGWKAYVDGHQRPIRRAYHLFRSVELGEGTPEVRFVYDPTSLKLGLAISLATVALLVAYCLRALSRRATRAR